MIEKNKKILLIVVGIVLMAAILLLPETALAKPLADQVREEVVVRLWRIVLGIVNVAAIIGLIVLAVANILRVQIETYNIRRMLPTLVLAIIFANFSHLLCRIGIDFVQILTNFFIQDNPLFNAGVIDRTGIATAFGLNEVSPTNISGLISLLGLFFGVLLLSGGSFLLVILAGVIIIFIPSLLVFALALLMYVRIYVIWFLVVLSPLAFFAMFFEPLKTVWGMWWNWFLKWLFLAPVGFFFLRMAVEVGQARIDYAGDDSVSHFAIWIFGLGMVFFALYVPFSWGSAVFNALKMAGARGFAGLSLAKRFGAQNLASRGATWKRAFGPQKPGEPPKKPWLYKMGRGMEWAGKKGSFSLGKAISARMSEIESKEMDATFESALGKKIAGPQRAAIEQAKKLNETYATIPDRQAMEQNLDNGNIQAYLSKCKDSGQMLSGISDELTLDEREGCIAYTKFLSATFKSASRADADLLMEAYEKSGVDFSKDAAFQRTRRAIDKLGIYTESVPGGGTPQTTKAGELPPETVTQRVNVQRVYETSPQDRANERKLLEDLQTSITAGDIETARLHIKLAEPDIDTASMDESQISSIVKQKLAAHLVAERMGAGGATKETSAQGTAPPTGGGGAPNVTPTQAGRRRTSEGSAGGGGGVSRAELGAVRRDIGAIEADLRAHGVPEDRIEIIAKKISEKQQRAEKYRREITGAGSPEIPPVSPETQRKIAEKPKIPPRENK